MRHAAPVRAPPLQRACPVAPRPVSAPMSPVYSVPTSLLRDLFLSSSPVPFPQLSCRSFWRKTPSASPFSCLRRGLATPAASTRSSSSFSPPEALRSAPEHSQEREMPGNLDALLLSGEKYARAGRWGDAVRVYRNAVRDFPSEGAVWAGLGLSLERLGKYTEATQALEKALALNPKYTPAFMPLARIAVARGRDEEAQRWLERAVYFEPDLGEARLAQAAVAAHLGKLAEAERILRDLIANPPAPRLLTPLHAGVQLGQLLARQRRFSEAMDQFMSIAEIAQHPPEKEPIGSEEAEEAHERLVGQVRDAAVQALNGAAGIAQLASDVNRSCELFAQAIRHAPDSHSLLPLLHARYATALLACGKLEMAEIEATRALSAANAASKSEEAIVATAVAHMALAQAALRNLAVPSQRVAFAHFGRALTALQRQRQQRSRAIDSSSPASGSIASQMAQCHMLRARTALNMAATMQPGIFSPPLTDHENAILPHEPGALSPLITSGTPDADAQSLAGLLQSALSDIREAARLGVLSWQRLLPLAHAAALGSVRV